MHLSIKTIEIVCFTAEGLDETQQNKPQNLVIHC
jgi:hypothetical protein